jgi:hypothetical protein
MPSWMMVREPERRAKPRPAMRSTVRMSRYSDVALENAVRAIVSAPEGAQRDTLNRECFAIGRLVASGILSSPYALEALNWAAQQMLSYDVHRPWRVQELKRLVSDAFLDGLQRPRAVPAWRLA